MVKRRIITPTKRHLLTTCITTISFRNVDMYLFSFLVFIYTHVIVMYNFGICI